MRTVGFKEVTFSRPEPKPADKKELAVYPYTASIIFLVTPKPPC